MKQIVRHTTLIALTAALLLMMTDGYRPPVVQAHNQFTALSRRVNVPYLIDTAWVPAIFWFGKVSPTSNYADVRTYYYDETLQVVLHIFDRLIWSDSAKSVSDFSHWDAVSLYLNKDGNSGGAPGKNAFLFGSQLNFQVSYQGDGAVWKNTPVPFTAETTWRGNGLNDNNDDKGWQVKFTIPFASLGLSGPPPFGTIWGMALAVHDRDDGSGTPIPDQIWPEMMNPNVPATWAQMHFGVPGFIHPPAVPKYAVTIRQGLNGVTVKDAHVGGHTTCGVNVDHWTQWGNTNYAGYKQINIQNQWDVSDWPCFSKYFVSFPLDSLPKGEEIISATLTMVLFGNAGGGQWGVPPDSYIQVLTVGEDWNESTITWNNAPYALENISWAWVPPRDYSQPDQPYTWNVSRAVADAYAAGKPLNLALYSADGERHSGKYFWSSDEGDWNASARPTLRVLLGNTCNDPGIECSFVFLPMTRK